MKFAGKDKEYSWISKCLRKPWKCVSWGGNGIIVKRADEDKK